VTAFANSGVLTGSLMRILGADSLLAGLRAKNRERASHAEHYLQNGTFELLHLVCGLSPLTRLTER